MADWSLPNFARTKARGQFVILTKKLAEAEHSTNGGRPFRRIQTVLAEQRDGEAIHPKRNTAGMRDRARRIAQTPDLTKVIEMIIEAHTSGRAFFGQHRDEQFEFEGLLQLAYRHHLAGAPKKWIACRRDAVRQAQFVSELARAFDPEFPEVRDFSRRADKDILPHPE
jgi:hypothetical protein